MSTVGILAAREYTSRLKSKGFIIGTVIGVIGIVGLSFISAIGTWLTGTFTTSIALVGPDAMLTRTLAQSLREDYKVKAMRYWSSGPKLAPALQREVVKGTYDAALVASAIAAARSRSPTTPRNRQACRISSRSSTGSCRRSWSQISKAPISPPLNG